MSIVEKMARAISGAPLPSAKSMARARAAIAAAIRALGEKAG